MLLPILLFQTALILAQDLDADGWEPPADCDDTNPTVHPYADEICDGLDNDCLNNLGRWEQDLDGDGWLLCEDDCDDEDPLSFPDAAELADEVDNDCDLHIDEGTAWGDDDGDGWTERDGDCDDNDPDVVPDPARLDLDCDGQDDVLDPDRDADGDGYIAAVDCDDSDPLSYPGAEERLDGRDNDCDGESDPYHGCGEPPVAALGALLLPPMIRRRRWRGLASGLAVVFAITIPTAHAEEPDETADWLMSSTDFYGGFSEARRTHDELMERAAAQVDGVYVLGMVSERQQRERQTLEHQLLMAEQRVSELRQTVQDANTVIARGAPLSAPKVSRRERQAMDQVSEALELEERLWGASLPTLPTEAQLIWRTTQEELERGQIASVAYWHHRLKPYRVLLPIVAGTDGDWATIRDGSATALALEAALNEDGSGGYEAAIAAPPDERGLDQAILDARRAADAIVETELEIQELEALLRGLEATELQVSDTSMVADALDVLDTYHFLINQAGVESFPLENATWAELFWRAGVAALIADERAEGARLLAQAAAVSADPLPVERVPPFLRGELGLADAESRLAMTGTLRGHMHPETRFTVDGEEVRTVFGEVEVDLVPGWHRVTAWSSGQASPEVHMVPITLGSTIDLHLDGPPPDLAPKRSGVPRPPSPAIDSRSERAELSDVSETSSTVSPHVGAGAFGVMAHGTSAVGAEARGGLEVGLFSMSLSAGLAHALDPRVVGAYHSTQQLWRITGSVSRAWSVQRLELSVGAGAYVHPWLGAGPELILAAATGRRDWRVSFDVRAGADTASHPVMDVPRWTTATSLTLWHVRRGG